VAGNGTVDPDWIGRVDGHAEDVALTRFARVDPTVHRLTRGVEAALSDVVAGAKGESNNVAFRCRDRVWSIRQTGADLDLMDLSRNEAESGEEKSGRGDRLHVAVLDGRASRSSERMARGF